MKMFVRGHWVDTPVTLDVTNPFDGTIIDTVPKAEAPHLEQALAGAVEGARIMRAMPAFERSEILRRAASILRGRQNELGRLISLEEGKTLKEGIGEVGRAAETIDLSAEEAKRLGGEVLPMDGAPGAAGRFGFTLRVPCGVVVAISPFNFPLNLPCHKVGPAIAGGNAVILKPASDTPLISLKLTEILLEAGLPELAISCVTGSGKTIGDVLCRQPGRWRTNHARRRYQASHARARLEQPGHCDGRCRSRPGRSSDDCDGLCQRRPGLHLRAARHRVAQGLWRLARCTQAED
jgi:acyl-CoA reductase-like NAD-dependent aldehyde dehydrogenase